MKKKPAKKAPKKRKSQKNKKNTISRRLHYVTVKKDSRYGKDLYGTKVYYEGKRPSFLQDSGKFKFGKHILETLHKKFGDNFKFVITKQTDDISEKRGKIIIKLSQRTLDRMNSDSYEVSRELKLEIVEKHFSALYPKFFSGGASAPYVGGAISRLMRGLEISQLSSADKEAIKEILPDFIASESIKSMNLLKAEAQITSLKELQEELKVEINKAHPESWWQNYVEERILVIQQGYIKAITNLNTAIGKKKFPDFALVSHDSYLDVLEIKKPTTNLLKFDKSRSNYFWDQEIAKAISQTENYLSQVERFAPELREYLKDEHDLDLQILKPRGIILAGDASNLKSRKEKDDLRRLSEGMKNITVITYDELSTRLQNYISVLESYQSKTE